MVVLITEIGFVPNIWSFPLVGATRGEVFVEAMPIIPCSKAMSTYHWQMPKWFDLLAETQPMPEDLALEMARFMLKST